jgi:hypothetical protein
MAAKNKDLINDKKLQKKYKNYKEVTKAKTIKPVAPKAVVIPKDSDLLATTQAKKFKYKPNVTLVKVVEELEAINKILTNQNKDILDLTSLVTNIEVDVIELEHDLEATNNKGLEAEVELSNRISRLGKLLIISNLVTLGLSVAATLVVAHLLVTTF